MQEREFCLDVVKPEFAKSEKKVVPHQKKLKVLLNNVLDVMITLLVKTRPVTTSSFHDNSFG